MEKLSAMEPFNIPNKNASDESQLKWRENTFTLNRKRRFRHTANVEKRKTMSAERKVRTGITATRAALKFIEGGLFALNVKEAVFKAEKHGFKTHAQELTRLNEKFGVFNALGRLQGIADKLQVPSLEGGINGTPSDLSRRKEIFGTNTHTEKPPKGFFVYVWEALHDLTLMILVVCAILSLVIGVSTEGLSEGWHDGAGILMSILIVVFVTATSDYRQSLQFRDLEKEKKKIFIQVTRHGRRQKVPIHDLVVGDVVYLSIGDQIPADGLFINGFSLTIDESSLTGESEPVLPTLNKPFLLAGTKVQDGSGKMLITGVGMNTEWGNLLSSLSEVGNEETPLQVKLNGVATLVGKIGLGFAILTFAILLFNFCVEKEDLSQWSGEDVEDIVEFFTIAVTIIVVAVPEGLPLAVTLSLAYAMKQMMKDKALVRHLSACETMGSSTCICSDKTGTLTTNQMTVVKVWAGEGIQEPHKLSSSLSEKALELLLESIFQNTSGDVVEYNDQRELLGSPTETAILRFGLNLGGAFKAVRAKATILTVEPFNSSKKKMAVLIGFGDGKYRAHCKGASEIVLGLCDNIMDSNGNVSPLDNDKRIELEAAIDMFAKDALRTLCLAFKDIEGEGCGIPDIGFTCVAIVGIKDPVRPGVVDAVNLCVRAGIRVRMVTGDNIETAKAIARECNILTEDGIAVEGPVFRKWTEAEMMENVPKLQVMARSSPGDKLLLVKHLKREQHVVAVTGDGTNDAPALHEADIGLAMGIAGTEVAKESADVIILDDNFSTIVTVAKWGRSIYTNIQKFVQFQLTVNLVALLLNFSSACITGRAPLTAVQLLWVNLIMDTLGALALATEPPYDELMDKAPVGRKGTLITAVMWRNIFGQTIYQLFVLWQLQSRGKMLLNLHGDDAQDILDTMIFNTFVFCQVFNELNSRQLEKLNVFKNTLNNRVFVMVMVSTVAFQIVMVEVLGKLANTVHLTKEQWLISVLIGGVSLFVAFLVKLPLNGNWRIAKRFVQEQWLVGSAVAGLVCVMGVSLHFLNFGSFDD
ncbi:hypothetical protein L7F22_038615 [Adiantum nelumboides]|nr:hypothetical protein [Adiantum nelumboides]